MNPIVYYVTDSDRPGQVKIGSAADLDQRMYTLQRSGVVKGQLILLAVELGGKMTELNRHTRFAGMRLDGEWFTYGAPIIHHVMNLDQSPVPFGRAYPGKKGRSPWTSSF